MNDIDINKLSECIVIAKFLVDEIGLIPSYESIIKMSTKLKLEPYEVMEFINFYKTISQQMII